MKDQFLAVSDTVFLVRYLVARYTVAQNTTNITAAIVMMRLKSIPGVLIMRISSICIPKPKLNTIPKCMPLVIDTKSLMSIYKKIMILKSVTETPMALSILYISA